MRQLIIARKDLQMGAGKLSAQVGHASMAFLMKKIKDSAVETENGYETVMAFEKDVFEKWINGIFTKTVCAAKNRNDLMKAVKISEDLGLVEGRDFFLIRDSCLTELEPEEFDDAGNGMTLTCIGFSPMDDDLAHKISRKYQLYR